MNITNPGRSVSLAVKAEFQNAVSADWGDGVLLPELLERVNRVASTFASGDDEAGAGEGRVKKAFSERSLRHYQTMGCIDSPGKDGRRSIYGLHHFIQALLVRKLLWERMSSEQIVGVLEGQSSGDLAQMFLEGFDLVPKPASGTAEISLDAAFSKKSSTSAEVWKRLHVAPGVELHLHGGFPVLSKAVVKHLVAQITRALERHRH